MLSCGHGDAPRTRDEPAAPDAELGLPPASLHAGLPRALRRRLRRQVPRLRDADVHALGPGGDQSPLHRAQPRPAAGPQHLPRTDSRRPLAAAARRRGPHGAPQADAALLPRRADARSGAGRRRDRRRRDRLLAARRGVRPPPPHAGDHPRGDPAGRLRRRRRAAARAPARPAQRPADRDLLADDPAARPRHQPRRRPCPGDEEIRGADGRNRRAALRRDRRAPHEGRPRGPRRHPLGADPRPLRGRRGDERHRPARPADDPAARRPRDDGDGARLELRPAASPRGRAGPPARLARSGRGRLPAGDDHRVAAAAAGRPARRPPPDQGARRR